MHKMNVMNTKDLLLEKALDLFSKEGYDAVSVRKLTRAIGIRESSFYNHYSAKKDLLNEIFRLMQKDLEQSKPASEEMKKLTTELSLEAYLVQSIDRFMEKWRKPHAAKVWSIISMEQYRNREAAAIILMETERALQKLEAAFKLFQQKNIMVAGDTSQLARLYGYAIRSIHLEYSLRSFISDDANPCLEKMYETARVFARTYSKETPSQ